MLISPAYAQGATDGGALGAISQFLPLILIFGVFYFLLIRPQQQKQKEMKLALSALKRGDRIVTGGGVLGTVSKPPKGAEDREIEVEIAPTVKITVLRETISAVITPQAANDARPARPAGQGAAAKPMPDLQKEVKAWLDKKGWFNKKKG